MFVRNRGILDNKLAAEVSILQAIRPCRVPFICVPPNQDSLVSINREDFLISMNFEIGFETIRTVTQQGP